MPITKQKIISGDHWDIDDLYLDRGGPSLNYTAKLYPDQASGDTFQGAFDIRRKIIDFEDLPLEHRQAIRALRNYLLTDLNVDLGGDGTIINE